MKLNQIILLEQEKTQDQDSLAKHIGPLFQKAKLRVNAINMQPGGEVVATVRNTGVFIGPKELKILANDKFLKGMSFFGKNIFFVFRA